MNQHQSIDTASDLRDLIAVTPEELETPVAKKRDTYEIRLDVETFSEMRLQLLAYKSDLKDIQFISESYRKGMAERIEKVLDESHWNKVKFIYE